MTITVPMFTIMEYHPSLMPSDIMQILTLHDGISRNRQIPNDWYTRVGVIATNNQEPELEAACTFMANNEHWKISHSEGDPAIWEFQQKYSNREVKVKLDILKSKLIIMVLFDIGRALKELGVLFVPKPKERRGETV